jgi:muramoyltetrapeptide carboxypeptidase
MTPPPFLQNGDAVALISPSKALANGDLDHAINVLSGKGLKPHTGANALKNYRAFAAEEALRLHDLNEAICNPDIKAIFCNRGGYGAMHLLRGTDLVALRQNPKWLIGYSDITALHLLWQQQGICSIHGAMPRDFRADPPRIESYQLLLDMLMGQALKTYEWNTPARNGRFEGQLIGGNLSLLSVLLPSTFTAPEVPFILFIEEISEELYHIERMLVGLWLSGALDKCRGILAGQFTDCKDRSGWFYGALQEVFTSFEKRTDIPIISDFPAGHEPQNWPMILGNTAQITVKNGKGSMAFCGVG